jgi:hypothetical protein
MTRVVKFTILLEDISSAFQSFRNTSAITVIPKKEQAFSMTVIIL